MPAVERPAPTDILSAGHRLVAALDGPWPLAPAGLEARRRDLLALVRGRLIPLAEGVGGPLVAVIAGSTGVGKSSLLNGLAGRLVSETSVLRPTTSRPVVWAHPDHAPTFRSRSFGGVAPLVVVDDRRELERLVVVDAPDFDSGVAGHREAADALLASADVVVFVSSPARFGDLAPWNRVLAGLSRGVPMLHVLNRADGASVAAVRATVPVRVAERGLPMDPDEVIPVAEQPLDPVTLGPPPSAVRHILSLLVEIAEEDVELARHQALEGLRAHVAGAGREVVGAAVELAARCDEALEALAAIEDGPVARPLPDAAAARLRAPTLARRLRSAAGGVPEAILRSVEDRFRVEVASSAAMVAATWRAHVPDDTPGVDGIPDPGEVARTVWATWADGAAARGATASDLVEGPGWAELVRAARTRLVAPHRSAVAASAPDASAMREAINLLAGRR